MSMSSRDRLAPSVMPAAFPSDTALSADQLAAVVGISVQRLTRLVALGIVEPAAPGADEFTAASAMRLARMRRLHQDLGVRWVAAAIIADLVARLEDFERR